MAAPKDTKLQLIVDCQVLQTYDSKRGMGFYLRSLLTSVAKEPAARQPAWVFVLNARMPKLEAADKALLDEFGGQIIEGDFLHQGDHALFDEAADKNRIILDKLLKSLLENSGYDRTIFFTPAQFSRQIYPVFPTHGTANLMLFHDLIPYLYYKQYFHDHEGLPRKDYAQRFREVYKANLFVANSQTTADDLLIYFGVDQSRIVTLFGAAADRHASRPAAPKIAKQLLETGFVLMPSGDDFRKNNELAVQAYAALKAKEKLVITSDFGPESQRMLRELCPNIVFRGRVSDDEMLWLMEHAKVVYYPPLYEGFALPLLEAVEANATVACSNISVFAEVSKSAFFYFDPTSVASMTEALEKALRPSKADKAEIATQKREYPKLLAEFTWPKAAERFLDALSQCQPSGPKQKLAIFCPSPVSYSGVGKYAIKIHAELSRFYDIDYFIEEGQTEFDPVRANILEYAAPGYYPAGSFDVSKAGNYDQILYHIGNSEFHIATILNSLRLPASAIIHDTKLNGIFDYMKNYGFMSGERREYELLLDKVFDCKYSSCLASIATNQRSIFCHSKFAQSAVREVAQENVVRTEVIFHPIGVPVVEIAPASKPTVSFAGIISEDKSIHMVSEVSKLGDILVKVFGFGVLGDSPLLKGLAANVKIITDLTDKEYEDAMSSTDILVNYRPNYHGETSNTTLEAMRYGKVAIVKDIGWFGELPDDAVVKVNSEAEVLEAVRMLLGQPQKRRKIGEAARRFLREQYTYERYVQLLMHTWKDEQR